MIISENLKIKEKLTGLLIQGQSTKINSDSSNHLRFKIYYNDYLLDLLFIF